MNKKELKKQADEVMRIAKKAGLENDYFFVTTFERYQVQLSILEELEKVIRDEGMLVTKEYVKNRKNVYTNPAVSDYNRTTDSANKTVSTLLKILKTAETNKKADDEDPLLDLINGGDEDDEQ